MSVNSSSLKLRFGDQTPLELLSQNFFIFTIYVNDQSLFANYYEWSFGDSTELYYDMDTEENYFEEEYARSDENY